MRGDKTRVANTIKRWKTIERCTTTLQHATLHDILMLQENPKARELVWELAQLLNRIFKIVEGDNKEQPNE